MPSSLADWKTLVEIVQGTVTSLALILGGAWTYLVFVKQRQGFPHLQTSILVHPVRIDEGWILHTEVQISNVGPVIACVPAAELRLRQKVPLPEEVADAVRNGFDPVDDGPRIEWPMLAGRRWKDGFEIEPGEIDALHADFFVSREVSVVEFYAHLSNGRKRRKGLGWSCTTTYRIPKEEKS